MKTPYLTSNCALQCVAWLCTATALAGSIDREFYDLIGPGTKFEDLINSGRLDSIPDLVETLTGGLKSGTGQGDEYGSRIRGFIQAPATGNYLFFIRSDEGSRLSLSPNHTAAGAKPIAQENGCCTALFTGDRLAERRSAAQGLEKGKFYFIEVLHKEGQGNDYVEVGWQRPDGAQETVPSAVLLPYAPANDSAVFDEAPTPTLDVVAGNTIVLSVTVRVSQPATIRWLKDGAPVPDTNLQVLTIDTAKVSDSGSYTCEVTSATGVKKASAASKITVVPDTTAPVVVGAELNVNKATVVVRFDERVDPVSASVADNYVLNNGVSVSLPQLSLDSRSVTLKTSALAPKSKGYTLTVKNLADRSGNKLTSSTVDVNLTFAETFDSNLGIFDLALNNTSAGNNFRWVNSNEAGGSPGELGGKIQRRSNAGSTYAAVSNLGGTLTLEQDLMIRGKMRFKNQNFDGALYFGFVGSVDALGPVVGFSWAEPNGATGPGAFRGFVHVGGGLGDLLPWPAGPTVNLEFKWEAATGKAIGIVNGERIERDVGQRSDPLTGFIIGSWGTSDTAQATEWFWDDLTFTAAAVPGAPEPVQVSLIEPKAGRVFPAGADVTLEAAAHANQGTLAKVEFFASRDGGAKSKIGEDATSPYSIVYSRVPPGNYVFSATASNNQNTTANSSDVAVRVAAAASVTTTTETFDTGPGKFTFEQASRENGNDIGFQNSNNAGGKAGEFGGTLVRTAIAALAGDGSLGGPLSPATQRLVIRSKLKIVPQNFDGGMFFGYVNRAAVGTRLGINMSEPGGGFEPNYRATLVAPGGGGPIFGLEPNLLHEVNLVWDPAAQTLSGNVGSHVVSIRSTVPLDAVLDVFGMMATDAGSDRPDLANQVFIDDVTYSVIGVPTITETFNTGLGAFDGLRNANANGNNFGFSNTALAGSAAGEAGGTFARTTRADIAYLGDISLGGSLGQFSPLTMKGKFFLQTGTFDGGLFLGYADLLNPGTRLGIDFAEPGGSVAPNWRVRATINGQTSDLVPVAPDKVQTFDLAWNPATAKLTGTIAGQSIAIATTVGDALYDSFIMAALDAGSTVPNLNGKFLLDEVTYNYVSDAPTLAVKLVSPVAETTLATGSDVNLVAEPTVLRGAVTLAEFFAAPGAGSPVKIGEAAKAPFALTWRPTEAGDYTLTVKLVSDSSLTATSSGVAVRVIQVLPVSLRTESFGSGPGAFTVEVKNRIDGNDFGFSNTANASGPAGELGGVFRRTTSVDAAYVADGNLGGRLIPAFQDLVLKGKLFLRNQNFDGLLFVGYADSQNLGVGMGINISEPGGTFAPNFRTSVVIPGGASPTLGIADSAVHEFDLKWTASTRTLAGKYAGNDIQVTGDPGAASFDAFVVAAYGVATSNPDLKTELYLDELTYSYAVAAGPAISIGRAGANVVLSWTTAGFRLQSRDGFGPGTGWAESAAQVVEQAGTFRATITANLSARFWRLAK